MRTYSTYDVKETKALIAEAKALKKYAEDHPDIIKPHGMVKSTTQYIKI